MLYAWVFNSTGWSLVAVMVAHAGHNIANVIVPSSSGDHLDAVVAVLYVTAAAFVVAFGGRRLGQSSERRAAASRPALTRGGHPVSADNVATMLHEAGTRLQGNAKTP